MKLVFVVLVWIILNLKAIYCEEETPEETQERIQAELRFTDLDLADLHEGITATRKKVLWRTKKYNDEIELITNYGSYLQEQSVNFLNIPEDDVPYEYLRNYTLLLKPGDPLLNRTDFHKLMTFAKENDHLSRNFKIMNLYQSGKEMGKQMFLDFLATSRNLSLLQDIWSNWQDGISKHFNNFEHVLSLVNKAASKNEQYDAKAYWEMLTEHEDGYGKAETLWNDIEPLYRKLHEFVLNRINNYYKTNFTDIPVYLTGSNFGEDWSNLAELVVPHQQMYKDAQFAFQTKSIIDIYKLADVCGQKMGFQRLPKKSWSKKNFEYDFCAPTLLTYSNSKYSEIMTCKNLTWSTYLSAHQVILEAGLKGIDYQSLPRRELRHSPLDEAIASLGSIIAINNLPVYGLTPESDYVEFENATEHGLAAKLLVALQVLPKLAFYITADLWRLEVLQNTSDDMIATWWEMRSKYQGVQGVHNEEADFLNDPFITSNRPYLAKFLGTILQFQLLSYHQLTPFAYNDNIAEQLGHEIDYRNAILDIPLKSPTDVLMYNYGYSEITAASLTEFFQPLEDYFDNAPLIPYPTIIREQVVAIPPEVDTERVQTTTAKEIITTPEKPEIAPVQNDQESSHTINPDTKDVPKPTESPVVPATGHSAGMYVVITIGACFFILVAVIVFKKVVKMKRPRTNNRRFET